MWVPPESTGMIIPPATGMGQQAAPVQHTWRSFLAAWWKAMLAVLPVFLITRVVFLLLTYFGGILFFLPNYTANTLSLHDILYTWNRWDAIRFATIAAQGYIRLDYAAFFPLFPALERLLSDLTHRDPLLCGMLISNIFFLGALTVLYRLAETEFDRDTASRATLYLSVFPTALFFFAAYNESLFLFFLLLSFYALRRGNWWIAGLFGGLATLTRSIGLLLFVIFFIEYIRHQIQRRKWARLGQKQGHVIGQVLGLPASLLIPAGLAIYAYGLYKHFGDPLAFSHAQVYWRTTGIQPPWEAPYLAARYIVKAPFFGFYTPHNIIDLTAFLLFLLLLILAFVGPMRFAPNQWTFVLFGLLALVFAVIFPGIPGSNPALPYDPLPSMQRFVLEIFAGYIALARLGRYAWFHQSYLLLSLPMLAFFTLQFMTGHWTI